MGYFDAITQPQQVKQEDGSVKTQMPTAIIRPPPQVMQQPAPIPFSDDGVFAVPKGTFQDAPGTFMPDGSKQQIAARQGEKRGGGVGGMLAPTIPLEPSQSASRKRASPFQMDMNTPSTSKLSLGMPSASRFSSRPLSSNALDEPLGEDEI